MFFKVVGSCFLLVLMVVEYAKGDATQIQNAFYTVQDEKTNLVGQKLSGEVPAWVRGTLLKQRCATIGENSQSTAVITHLLDCLGMASAYKIRNKKVRYSNRNYFTRPFYLWRKNNNNMQSLGVAWSTLWTTINSASAERLKADGNEFPIFEPSMSYWRLVSEYMAVNQWTLEKLWINPNTLIPKGSSPPWNFKFNSDPVLWWNGDYDYTNVAAHAVTDWDGTIWSSTAALTYNPNDGSGTSEFGVFTIHPVSDMRLRRYNLRYPDFNSNTDCAGSTYVKSKTGLIGFTHSLAQTDSYVIVPMSSYVLDVCSHYATGWRPYMKDTYKWDNQKSPRFIFMNKWMWRHNVDVDVPGATLFTHTINAFEDTQSQILNLDMVTYNDATVYSDSLQISNIIQQTKVITSYSRRYKFAINNAMQYIGREDLTETTPLPMEYPCVNPRFVGKRYKYAYFVHQPYRDGSSIVKLNVDTRKLEGQFQPSAGFYVEEPQFVPAPIALLEDEGVILVTGVDSSSSNPLLLRGLLWFLNARNLHQLAVVRLEAQAPFGLHAVWYDGANIPPDWTDSQTTADVVTGVLVGTVVALPVIVAMIVFIVNS